jgi:gamma-glutamyltranspeptidase/glutathione hydrolase
MVRWDFPYPSRRMPVLADNVVATSQPLAAQAGAAMFAQGGNAVDAAVAAAIALTVVEPTSNGIGGDAFALVWDGQRRHALNASGRSSARLDPERFLGRDAMPLRGWDPVTVPGVVSAWVALALRFGRLGLDAVAAPAIRYARHGFPVSPITALAWARAAEVFTGFDAFATAFLPGGRAPRAGERFALPEQADTLTAIAATEGAAFYRGALAERIAACAATAGAPLDGDDLAAHEPEWVDPLAGGYQGWRVDEVPPNTQGIAALETLGVLERTDLAAHGPGDPDWLHLQIEAMKLAFADAHTFVADRDAMTVEPAALLEPAYLDERAAAIEPGRAADPGHGRPRPGGTVYLAAADADGLLVSYIQSNYTGFGSGVVVPGTGIALQNRGAGFSTVPGHPNVVAPRKRPFHTIIPALAAPPGADAPQVAYGVMGGPMQPQGHVQVLVRLADHDENAQAALDAPRWRVDSGLRVTLEAGFPVAAIDALSARGHELEVAPRGLSSAAFGFGGAQLVQRLPGGWLAASDPRKDGQAVGW